MVSTPSGTGRHESTIAHVNKRHTFRRLADLSAAARLLKSSAAPAEQAAKPDVHHRNRQLVADLCRLVGSRVVHREVPDATGETNPPRDAPEPQLPQLSRRMRQTLERLLAGDSEKQIANRFGVSRNTVHTYVKALYKTFNVNSRGELLAKFVRRTVFATDVRASGNEDD